MKRSIRVITFFVLAAACFLSAAFGMKETIKNKFSHKKIKVLVVFSTSDAEIEFWKTLREGIQLAAKNFNVEVSITAPNRENDVKGQVELLEKGVLEKPDAIVLAPIDYNALVPIAGKIKKAGIKLVIIDSGLNSEAPDSFITTDNVEAGRKAVTALADRADEAAKVVIMSYVQFSPTAIDREKGVREELSRHKNLQVTETYYCDATRKNAYETAKQLIRETKELEGIICLNEMTTLGVAQALDDLKLGEKINLVGFDSSFPEIKMLEKGIIKATVVQRPFNMGYLSIEAIAKADRRHPMKKRINTGSQVVTKENMYSDENQKLLFPFYSE